MIRIHLCAFNLRLSAALLLAAAMAACGRAQPAEPALSEPSAGRPLKDALLVRVLVLNFDPIVSTHGKRPLHAALDWQDPRTLAHAYTADVTEASGGFIRFDIVEWREIDGFPRKADGFAYSVAEYVENHRRGAGWHEPDRADYRGTLRDRGVLALIDNGSIDEVWLFGGPYFGYNESAMAGPGAFEINGDVFDDVPVSRPFAIMGFNYERGVAEMLENLCHRTEATMSRIYGGWRAETLDHAWARFAANEAHSGAAAVGSCHWPPNAMHEYDFANERPVASTAPAWLSYPQFSEDRRMVDREAWGGPDYVRNYFRWWFRHLPKAEGTGADGRAANWWKYVFDFRRYDERGM